MPYDKKNKDKKKYICPNCLKDFGNLKYQLELHLNRINPCKKINDNTNDNNIKNDNIDVVINNINTNNDDANNNINKHIMINDNQIKLNDEKNIMNVESIFNDNNFVDYYYNNNTENNYNNNQLIFELTKKIDHIIKQNEEFKIQNEEFKKQNEKINKNIIDITEEIIKLKEDNKKLSNQIILNNNNYKNINNTQINVNIINNFNDTKDFDGNFNNFLKEQGKNIYLKTIENVYLNPKKPENHNIYIADKNRGYAKIYNDGRWETKDINVINIILNNVVDYYKISLEKIKEDNEKYQKLLNHINSKIRNLNYCDLEFLDNLEDEQLNENADNKEKIKRCKDFREMVFKNIINLFHDKKDIVINTHKKCKNNTILNI
jgi:hypothetical protein